MDLLRAVENWAAPFVLVMTGALLWWAVSKANGFGPLLAQPGKFHTLREFLPVFVPSLTAMIGYWATLSLNMPDFTRFGRSQREQIIGQVVALPTTMSLFAAMGVMITSATAIIYGQAIWDPVQLVGKFSSPVVVAISMFTVVVATLAVNIAANVVSPANDFANAFPRFISFKTGGLITGILGIAIQPWRLLADPSGYIFTWLLGYSGGLGSIAGVLIADYWIVRRRELAPRGSLSRRRRVSRLELARDRRDRGRLRARLGRPRRSRAEAAVRLRVVRRLLRGRARASGARVERKHVILAPAPPSRTEHRHVQHVVNPSASGGIGRYVNFGGQQHRDLDPVLEARSPETASTHRNWPPRKGDLLTVDVLSVWQDVDARPILAPFEHPPPHDAHGILALQLQERYPHVRTTLCRPGR